MTAASSSYKGHRYPPEIIAHCVWLYHRFPLSFREVEELMLQRGVVETILRRYDLTNPVLWKIAGIIRRADLDDERYDAPEAPGLDVALRGLSMTCTDEETLTCTGPLFDGLYEYYRRATLLGREPA